MMEGTRREKTPKEIALNIVLVSLAAMFIVVVFVIQPYAPSGWAGDVDVLLLDKTGTITLCNRQGTEFFPAPGVNVEELVEAA